jgi:hypothetical protein
VVVQTTKNPLIQESLEFIFSKMRSLPIMGEVWRGAPAGEGQVRVMVRVKYLIFRRGEGGEG